MMTTPPTAHALLQTPTNMGMRDEIGWGGAEHPIAGKRVGE